MCDGRFSGASMDPLSKESDPDVLPDLQAIVSAYNGALNDYVRNTLHFGQGQRYLVSLGTQGAPGVPAWDWNRPQPAAAPTRIFGIANVMTDLASAMKVNADLKVFVSGGYFDFCSAYYARLHEIRHLPIPAELQGNIEYHVYPAGHWPYIHEPTLKAVHDDLAAFIRRSDNLPN
jgi:carboxypeptidase C (cathepsin A)